MPVVFNGDEINARQIVNKIVARINEFKNFLLDAQPEDYVTNNEGMAYAPFYGKLLPREISS